MPHIPAEAEAILKFLGSVVVFIGTVVGVYKRTADSSRKKAQDAVEAEYSSSRTPRAHYIEVNALRRELKETRDELLSERSRNATLTYATASLRAEYRRSLGLDSEPPPTAPNTPGAHGAVTIPPRSK